MINILYEPFPESVQADGKHYAVRTNFRDWLRYADIRADKHVPEQKKIAFLICLLKDRPLPAVTEHLVEALHRFYRADELHYHPENEEISEPEELLHKPPLFDWRMDACCLAGDFRRFYQIDIRNAELHWWEFLSLFCALPEESRCQQRIYYRNLDLSQIKDKSEKKRIRKIKRAIAIPYELSDEDIGAEFAKFF